MKTVKYNDVNFEIDESTLDIYLNGAKLKKQVVNKLNRIYVGYNDGKCPRWTPEYRIICLAFHPNSNYKNLQVDHIDNNPINDAPENLRWVSRKENNGRDNARKLRSMNATCTTHNDEVIQAQFEDGTICYFKNGREAAKKLKCSHVLIYNVLNPHHFAKTAKGCNLQWIKIADLPDEDTRNLMKKCKCHNNTYASKTYAIAYADGHELKNCSYSDMLKTLDIAEHCVPYRLKVGKAGKYVKGTILKM